MRMIYDIGFALNHITKSLFFCISPQMLIAAQSADMQYIVLFLNISNQESKDALGQFMQ